MKFKVGDRVVIIKTLTGIIYNSVDPSHIRIVIGIRERNYLRPNEILYKVSGVDGGKLIDRMESELELLATPIDVFMDMLK